MFKEYSVVDLASKFFDRDSLRFEDATLFSIDSGVISEFNTSFSGVLIEGTSLHRELDRLLSSHSTAITFDYDVLLNHIINALTHYRDDDKISEALNSRDSKMSQVARDLQVSDRHRLFDSLSEFDIPEIKIIPVRDNRVDVEVSTDDNQIVFNCSCAVDSNDCSMFLFFDDEFQSDWLQSSDLIGCGIHRVFKSLTYPQDCMIMNSNDICDEYDRRVPDLESYSVRVSRSISMDEIELFINGS